MVLLWFVLDSPRDADCEAKLDELERSDLVSDASRFAHGFGPNMCVVIFASGWLSRFSSASHEHGRQLSKGSTSRNEQAQRCTLK